LGGWLGKALASAGQKPNEDSARFHVKRTGFKRCAKPYYKPMISRIRTV
jgi:hypothetical protein